ncbi:UNVERIFIED_ORG: hypothetical protein J2X79_004226 [Arthrobacter globiformis]|nr:hypothetical protein [Arthrobacter globiformis]
MFRKIWHAALAMVTAPASNTGFFAKRKMILASIAVAAAALGGGSIAALPAEAATRLGGISVQNYCITNVDSGNYYVVSKALRINDLYHGWRCGRVSGNLVSVDMNKACRQQSPARPGQPQAYALHGQGIYSWACYR